ncbi:hypothetical protein [Lysobacter xanthus]
MRKFAFALFALSLPFVAGAEQVGSKFVYPLSQLAEEHADNVPGIVDKFMADTGRTSLINPSKVLFLLNGQHADEVASKLKSADRVEVLYGGENVVINVITKPAKAGA